MTTANIDHLAAMVTEYDAIQAEIKRLGQAAELLEQHIQHTMGEAESATIGGRPAFTWKRNGTFAAKRFTAEQPEAAERYTVLRPALDTDKLKAESPELYAAYRGRRFLRAQ